MKVCPKCARSFAEGFQFCPQDAAELVKYDLRAQLKQNEFQFLLEEESFPRRLAREFADAVYDFKHNPKSFLAGLLRGESSTRRRKQLLQAGMASAVIAYAAVMMAGLLIGLFTSPARLIAAKEPEAAPVGPLVQRVTILKPKLDEATQSLKKSAGKLGGSFDRDPNSGGGGGAHDKSPARAGVPTQASLLQLLPPNLNLPKPNPTLVTPMTVVADPNAFLKYKGEIGDWRGKGKDDSLGNSGRNGIGDGPGDGYSDGNKFGVGGNDPRFTRSKPTGTDADGDIPNATRDMRPTITYKERAKYTEDARQHRIEGTVILSLVLGADGRIFDVRIVRPLSHGLTEEAILAAQKIRFNPAVRNGRAVSVRMQIEYNFTLY